MLIIKNNKINKSVLYNKLACRFGINNLQLNSAKQTILVFK